MSKQAHPDRLSVRDDDLPLTAEQLRHTPLLAGAPRTIDRRLRSLLGQGATVIRKYQAGEFIVRQGEPGWTAFYLLRDADVRALELPPLDTESSRVEYEGEIDSNSATKAGFLLAGNSELPRKAEVFIAPDTSPTAVANPSGLTRLGDLFFRRNRRKQIEAAGGSVTVQNDDTGPLVAYLREGEIFGETSCFNHTPRSASIRAMEDCYVIELVRNVLEMALENERFKQTLDEIFRKRSLQSALTGIPIFEGAPVEALATVRRHAQMISVKAGEVVFDVGDEADAIYLVRAGTLALTRGKPGGRVIRYVSRGESLAIGEVLKDGIHEFRCQVYSPTGKVGGQSRRMVGRFGAELIRIPKRTVDKMVASFPEVATNARRFLRQRRESQASPATPFAVENLADALGLIRAEKVMLIDLDTCTRCNDCVRACADTHRGIPRLVRQGPRFGNFLIPDTCRQCLDPTCMIGCPVGSIHRGVDNEIVIENWCIGCGLCAEQCPYQAIQIETRGEAKKAVTCDQCASVGDGTPMCVYACGAGAARRVDGRTFFEGRGGVKEGA